MNILNFLRKKSYSREFNEYHRARRSFSWELANLEGKLLREKDPEKREELQERIEKVKFYVETTKKMLAATRLHDKGKYSQAIKLYGEVAETDIYYVDLVRKYMAKAKPQFSF
ncbi:MAG: hypothetical protein ACPGJS_21865 [Flammeovirgaceae bacterium]